MGLRPAVGVFPLLQLLRFRVHVIMPLRFAGDAVGVMEPGVEPLGRVGGGHLVQHHVDQLIVEGLGVFLGIKVTVPLAPVLPTAGKAVNHLLDAPFRTGHRTSLFVEDGIALLVQLRNSRLAKILGYQDVRRNLRPVLRNFRSLHFEDDRSIRVGDAAIPPLILHGLIGIFPFAGKSAWDLQRNSPLISICRHNAIISLQHIV